MADMLSRGAAWLEKMRLRHMVVQVIYEREGSRAKVMATMGKAVSENDSSVENIRIDSACRDFLINAAELKIRRKAILPRRGDLIRETRGNQVFVHEVMPLGTEAPYRWSDVNKTVLRIHTREIGVEKARKRKGTP